jgi:hypothetical protein
MIPRLRAAATGEVSAASGAVFRIGFGLVGLLLVIRFFAHGWVDSLFVDPRYHFPYPGFEWVTVWPRNGMYLHFLVIGVAAIGITLGYRYRLSAAVFALALAYVELIDRSLYLNHYYWLVLTATVMVFVPLQASYSLDARRGKVASRGRFPAWVVWVLRFQVGMVYFFAGLAKVNSDWLLRAEPLSTWLPARSELLLVGPLLTLPATAVAMSWAGAFFDLTVVGWLSWHRTRAEAYPVLVLFHGLTWALFPSIGLFPLLMSLAALVFLDPAWPESLLGTTTKIGPSHAGQLSPFGLTLAFVYAATMIVIPMRHYAQPGDVKWTGEGYLGSWQVMLSEKSATADFIVTDPATDVSWRVAAPDYLTERQQVVMATDPVMIRQTAGLIADDIGDVEVAADVRLSFNGRASSQFTDPLVVVSRARLTEEIEGFILPRPG